MTMPEQSAALLEARRVCVDYPVANEGLVARRKYRRVLTNIDLAVKGGEICGLVGQSGSGKSTLARAIMRLQDCSAGSILYRGTDITSVPERRLGFYRRQIQMVFQDPYSSLDPRMTILHAVREPLDALTTMTGPEKSERVFQLLSRVGIDPKASSFYPHQFSGGQRQRICIARALAIGPSILVADEAVSALDVSVRAQILNLLLDIREEYGLSIIFVSHDLAIVEYICDTVHVIENGRIVESALASEIFNTPKSEYTKKLISAVPKFNRT